MLNDVDTTDLDVGGCRLYHYEYTIVVGILKGTIASTFTSGSPSGYDRNHFVTSCK